jgi:DNA-binding transcriptional LysR family regulator
VSVTASVLFGHLYVVPALVAFLQQQPLIRVRSVLLDRVVDLMQRELDVAVRIAHLKDSSLHGVRVGNVRAVLCASPAYLEVRGVPQIPDDLHTHEGIRFAGGQDGPYWTLYEAGAKRAYKLPTRLVVSDSESAIYAATQGLGITRVLSYQVEEKVLRGELRLVLPRYEPPPIPVHVVHHGGRRATQRVRVLVDFLVERLRAALGFEAGRSAT